MLEFREEIDKKIPTDDAADIGERMLLYSIIVSIKPKVVVETGTHRGLTALYRSQA